MFFSEKNGTYNKIEIPLVKNKLTEKGLHKFDSMKLLSICENQKLPPLYEYYSKLVEKHGENFLAVVLDYRK